MAIYLAVRLVEGGREMLFGDGHSNRVRDALSERSCRDFHSWRHEVFGVPGCHGAQLPEVLQIVQSHVIPNDAISITARWD